MIRVIVMNEAEMVYDIYISNNGTHKDPNFGNYTVQFKNGIGQPTGFRHIKDHEKRTGILELIVSALMGSGGR